MRGTVLIDSDGLADWHLEGEDDPVLRGRIREAYVRYWVELGYDVWDAPFQDWESDRAAGRVSGPFHETSFEEMENGANAAWENAVGTYDGHGRFVDGKWVLVD